jgi:hypothetical protein
MKERGPETNINHHTVTIIMVSFLIFLDSLNPNLYNKIVGAMKEILRPISTIIIIIMVSLFLLLDSLNPNLYRKMLKL